MEYIIIIFIMQCNEFFNLRKSKKGIHGRAMKKKLGKHKFKGSQRFDTTPEIQPN